MKMQGTKKVVGLVLMICVFLFSANTFAQKVVNMEGHDNMKFTVTKITVKPGEKVTVNLKVVGKMPAVAMSHNFVLLQKGTDAADFTKKGARHKDTEYIDPALNGKVLAKTELGHAGQTVKVTFTAPKVKGDYPYVCTFPGHYATGMKGVLTVQ